MYVFNENIKLYIVSANGQCLYKNRSAVGQSKKCQKKRLKKFKPTKFQNRRVFGVLVEIEKSLDIDHVAKVTNDYVITTYDEKEPNVEYCRIVKVGPIYYISEKQN